VEDAGEVSPPGQLEHTEYEEKIYGAKRIDHPLVDIE
jgi:hypothetical protein